MRDAAQVAGYLRDRGDAVFTSFIFFLGTRQAVHSPAEPAWAGTFFIPPCASGQVHRRAFRCFDLFGRDLRL